MNDTKPLAPYSAIRLSSYTQKHLLPLPVMHWDSRVRINYQ